MCAAEYPSSTRVMARWLCAVRQSIRTAHNHLAITLVELGYSAAHILHAELGLSTLDELLVALTCGPDINVEDVDICVHPHVILGENGLFCRVHAAHTGSRPRFSAPPAPPSSCPWWKDGRRGRRWDRRHSTSAHTAGRRSRPEYDRSRTRGNTPPRGRRPGPWPSPRLRTPSGGTHLPARSLWRRQDKRVRTPCTCPPETSGSSHTGWPPS